MPTAHRKVKTALDEVRLLILGAQILFDLSFEVGPGEIVGLIGPNGAGKTTTLRSLAGILRPTSGRLSIDGHDLVVDPLEAKRRLAFMPDEPHLFEYLTVTEHLHFIALAYRVRNAEAKYAALLDELELADKKDEAASSLSRGISASDNGVS